MSGIAKTFDYNLLLDDGGSITSSEAGEIGGVAKIIDLGAGKVEGDIIVDVTALDVDSGNELVTLGVQISSSATFASDYYQVASLQIGDAAALVGDVDMTTGRYVIPFNNMIGDGVTKRYLRMYWTIAGTVAGFAATAYLAKKG
jgi:hypothetical protein